MRPTSTSYRLIADYDYYAPQIEALWSATDIPKFPTVYPQIVAERNGKVIGFVARRHDEWAKVVLIEPMIAPNVIVFMRLAETLEKILKQAGVTSFYFRLEPHRVQYEKVLKKAGKDFVETLGYDSGFHWFKRTIVA